MKTSQILIGIGVALVLSLLAWQLYMVQTPSYKRTYQRGLSKEFSVGKAQEKTTGQGKASAKSRLEKGADAPAVKSPTVTD
jgi:hypothetical protein